MIQYKSLLFLLLIVLIIICFPLDTTATPLKQVMVLHSYHPSFSWTQQVNDGIKTTFSEKGLDYKMFFEYMDVHNVNNKNYLENLYYLYREKYHHRELDLIIAVNNEALDFLLKNGQPLFPGVPIVFCGIVESRDLVSRVRGAVLRQRKMFNGYSANMDMVSNIDLITKLHPDTSRIIFYGSEGSTYTLLRDKLELLHTAYYSEGEKLEFIFKGDLTFSEIKEDIKNLKERDVVVLTTPFKSEDGSVIPPDKTTPVLVNNTLKPVYGIWNYFFGQGIIGGKLVNGYLQGERAGQTAVKIINEGDNIDLYPVIRKGPNQYLFDYRQLSKFNIELSDLPDKRKIEYKPVSYLKKHRDALIKSLVVIILLITGIVFLFTNNYRLRKMKEKIRNQKEELEENYHRLEEYNEELRAANEKIKYLSYHDELTGLYNRAFIEEEKKRLNTRRRLPLSIIMGDVNGLKLINDSFGHDQGDVLLQQIANVLKQSCRADDIIGRYGGDEFIILLPETTAEDARKICQRIKKGCKEVDGNLPVNIALGVGTKEKMKQDIDQVIEDADDLMYEDKLMEGSNCRRNVLDELLNRLEEKSFETGEHRQRMTELALKMGEALNLSKYEQGQLSLLASLHDIGKISISEEIIEKKNTGEIQLTPEEEGLIKEHVETGYRIARTMDDVSHIARGILYHHERWDGQGYPEGLAGEEIPQIARIINIIHTYDVMTNLNKYRQTLTEKEAIKELQKMAGKQLDPEMVEIFINKVLDFREELE